MNICVFNLVQFDKISMKKRNRFCFVNNLKTNRKKPTCNNRPNADIKRKITKSNIKEKLYNLKILKVK